MRYKKIQHHEQYEIGDDGSIISYVRNKEGYMLTAHKNNNGYLTVELNGTEYKVHRLVAEAYVPNPYNKPDVNHIDGNKANPHYSNLEWATRSENTLHAYATNLCPTDKGKRQDSRTVKQLTKHGTIVNTYSSITEAAKSVTDNISSGVSKIHQVCTGCTFCILWGVHMP